MQIDQFKDEQSRERTGNDGKAPMRSIIRPDTLYLGTLELHFRYISRLCIYIFQARTAMSMQLSTFRTAFEYKDKNV